MTPRIQRQNAMSSIATCITASFLKAPSLSIGIVIMDPYQCIKQGMSGTQCIESLHENALHSSHD
jgi:hypothetical protein